MKSIEENYYTKSSYFCGGFYKNKKGKEKVCSHIFHENDFYMNDRNNKSSSDYVICPCCENKNYRHDMCHSNKVYKEDSKFINMVFWISVMLGILSLILNFITHNDIFWWGDIILCGFACIWSIIWQGIDVKMGM